MQAHELKPGDLVEIVTVGRVVLVEHQPDGQPAFTGVLLDGGLPPLLSGRPSGFTFEIPDDPSLIATTITKL